ncbi:MAG: YebC/PmpR family DNA-binding transcriptional regulator [Candidatus Krumholzibacteriia bacterium]
MSGHSKWSTIKHKKAATDAKRSRLWTRLIREITVAAREGGDAEANPRLRAALLTAKGANMPKDTVEKAIKRGAGDLDGALYEEITYEGYGPGGVAILVETQTDNKNRTAAEVRHVFTKYGGKLGSTGCVSYLFERKGQILLDRTRCDVDTVMEAAVEAGAEDVEEGDESILVITAMEDLHTVAAALEQAGLPVESTQLVQEPATTVKVDEESVGTLLRLIDALDDSDDVSSVSANFDIDDEVLARYNEE